jgi:FKBP-type peptidyl-prolyl cis-trans isomerase 2
VAAHYTCRLENRVVIATTKEEVATGPEEKSSAFAMAGDDGPVILTARSHGVSPEKGTTTRGDSFEDAVANKLAEALPGMVQGQSRQVRLAELTRSDLNEHKRYHHMARVRKRSKELSMSSRVFLDRLGRVPEVGEAVDFHSEFEVRVKAVSGNRVVLAFTAKPGSELEVPPFGKGRIHDKGTFYEIVLDVPVGKLVRVGHRVGRIVESNDPRMFTVDFGHPFGGEALDCEVEVVEILIGE